jgi:hypothetical protein
VDTAKVVALTSVVRNELIAAKVEVGRVAAAMAAEEEEEEEEEVRLAMAEVRSEVVAARERRV